MQDEQIIDGRKTVVLYRNLQNNEFSQSQLKFKAFYLLNQIVLLLEPCEFDAYSRAFDLCCLVIQALCFTSLMFNLNINYKFFLTKLLNLMVSVVFLSKVKFSIKYCIPLFQPLEEHLSMDQALETCLVITFSFTIML